MSFSRLSAATMSPTAVMEMQSGKMAFAAIDCADQVPEPQVSSSPFIKGIAVPAVPQLNGRCGAQTCERRCCQAVTNISAECATDGGASGELPFLVTSFNSETAADMLQLRLRTPADEVRPASLWQAARALPAPWAREHLFQKALTPSDVGKLNRLVVPKQHAEKHLFDLKRNPMIAAAGVGMLIDFEDGSGKTWRFRYSFSAASRIYIITNGWRRFVRDKGLQAGDTVAFSRSAFGPYKQMHIDCWKTQKKPDDDAVADGIAAVDCRAVMLFGVDIVRA